MDASVLLHAPVALSPEKKPGNHLLGVWIGPRAGLEGFEEEKNLPVSGFDHPTFQHVA
jgi:hypothetical protein